MTPPMANVRRGPTRILCPTDFSPYSQRALQYAIALGRAGGGEITVLHVALLPVPAETGEEPDWMPPEPSMRHRILERMRRFTEPAEAAGVVTWLTVREGLPADEILKVATAMRADLIVMGSHGRRGFERFILGSTADRVLRTASCPVLTLSGPVDEAEATEPVRLARILCATNASERSAETVAYARALAKAGGAKLSFLHVAEGDSEATLAQLPSDCRVVRGIPYRAILSEAEAEGAELIVVGAQEGATCVPGFLGSTSEHLVREAPGGVLTVRPVESRPPATAHREAALTGAGVSSRP